MAQQRIDKFRTYYDLEFEVIAGWEPAEVSRRYLEALAEGKQQGFHPVFVSWDWMLIEQLDVELGEPDGDDLQPEMADLTHRLLDSATEGADLDRFLQERDQELRVPKIDLDADFDLEDKQELELLEFLYKLYNSLKGPDGETVTDLLLVKIPTTQPEEIFAHFPIGGINLCPPSAILITLAARWREKFGAVPAVITSDVVEFYVSNPPATIEAAAELAREQYLVCPQLVDEVCGNMENLTSNLIKNAQWFFWWR